MSFDYKSYGSKAYLGEGVTERGDYIKYSRDHLLPIPLESLLEGADDKWRSFWRDEVLFVFDEVWMPRKSSFGDFPKFFPISLQQSFVDCWFAAQSKKYYFINRSSYLERA